MSLEIREEYIYRLNCALKELTAIRDDYRDAPSDDVKDGDICLRLHRLVVKLDNLSGELDPDQ